ncbi:hypothetical protein [Dokdonella sp.]|uniref:tautomerase family protein n=1 Tax=Dokdonella sp. TaxID=2291710 RepID=UPI001B2E6CB6|nr:hypothetical protein [Dokdonella sp.]MBO9662839.1 hypothetical protein [Dokdonella sp.]
MPLYVAICRAISNRIQMIPSREWTHVTTEEVDTDNWGFGGYTTTTIREGCAPMSGTWLQRGDQTDGNNR